MMLLQCWSGSDRSLHCHGSCIGAGQGRCGGCDGDSQWHEAAKNEDGPNTGQYMHVSVPP